MLCSSCNIKKLRKEFPSQDFCSNHHIERNCLKCITKYIEDNNCCPICQDEILDDNKNYLACLAKIDWLFPELEDNEEESASIPVSSRSSVLVVMIGGESHTIPFNSYLKVKDFKMFVKSKFGIDPDMQKLLYQEKTLESYESHSYKTMGDYGVQANGRVQLVKILQTLSPSIQCVIFDFSWGFPSSGRDYLDTSALLYSDSDFIEYVDFRTRSRHGRGAVSHSGCISDGDPNRGRHRMQIVLNALPPQINKVFFTLSSWRASSIAAYECPRLQFYDVSRPERQLCTEEFDRAITSRAVIMCSVCRVNGKWKVFSLGVPSRGNIMVENYRYLKATIERIIQEGIC
ncbi:uncharacterized protein LOC116308710 [Actinia tenebrosa]|uniref:Uncharacterized protein LOC116308710 n=1 Tax=Actinia tenebrosa TaxID=6105 RepID=A0A6P8JBI1_ACTTE|nr:uncharacterized protein LOC116308710 [Actinia tenebrosa]XP_031575049.1 uncharacterized protein LOC116308710 [Actinia tenebrosa]XP_031575050.1 uncharacterized protein LOC116308710 [Actinia tenebrosa]XP_031575051.1 uncharacterized protein LOC116308710 [Actinia tenebrosa]